MEKIKAAVISSTNPKLSKFKQPFLLAIIIMLPVFAGVLGVTYITKTQCEVVCSMTPLKETSTKLNCSTTKVSADLTKIVPMTHELFGLLKETTKFTLYGTFGKDSDRFLCSDDTCDDMAFSLFNEPIRSIFTPPGGTFGDQLVQRVMGFSWCVESSQASDCMDNFRTFPFDKEFYVRNPALIEARR